MARSPILDEVRDTYRRHILAAYKYENIIQSRLHVAQFFSVATFAITMFSAIKKHTPMIAETGIFTSTVSMFCIFPGGDRTKMHSHETAASKYNDLAMRIRESPNDPSHHATKAQLDSYYFFLHIDNDSSA